jgi:general secretion pathway protein K
MKMAWAPTCGRPTGSPPGELAVHQVFTENRKPKTENHFHTDRLTSPKGEDGVVLLLVLWVLALISVMLLGWGQEWRTELKLASNFRDAHQCRRLAEAGVYYALGKLVAARAAEAVQQPAGVQDFAAPPPDVWRGDQSPRVLELPGGQVEIRIGEESGKFNLNLANEQNLTNLFAILGYPPEKVATLAASIRDWRKPEAGSTAPPALESPFMGGRRARGASALMASKRSRFETVEELSWVKGFENTPLLPRLADWFTVQETSLGVNVNTASLEVLQALGFSREQARMIAMSRQSAPFRSPTELPPRLVVDPQMQMTQPLVFRSSPFFTIKATGMINNKKVRHTIKAIARLDSTGETPWGILAWVDDFP